MILYVDTWTFYFPQISVFHSGKGDLKHLHTVPVELDSTDTVRDGIDL